MPLTKEEKHANRMAKKIKEFRALLPHNQRNEVLKKLQRLVILQSRDEDGFIVCVTCGKVGKPSRSFNAGHYISRSNSATCFIRKNIHVQCVRCNDHRHGNLGEYRKFLVQEFGVHFVELLESMQDLPKVEWPKKVLAEMYWEYHDMCKELERGHKS